MILLILNVKKEIIKKNIFKSLIRKLLKKIQILFTKIKSKMCYVIAFISTSIQKILISLIEIKFVSLVSSAEINYALRK